jgi:hypothetical protein
MTSEGSRYARISQNRAALPANGGNFAKETKKVENQRHSVTLANPRLCGEQTRMN